MLVFVCVLWYLLRPYVYRQKYLTTIIKHILTLILIPEILRLVRALIRACMPNLIHSIAYFWSNWNNHSRWSAAPKHAFKICLSPRVYIAYQRSAQALWIVDWCWALNSVGLYTSSPSKDYGIFMKMRDEELLMERYVYAWLFYVFDSRMMKIFISIYISYWQAFSLRFLSLKYLRFWEFFFFFA